MKRKLVYLAGVVLALGFGWLIASHTRAAPAEDIAVLIRNLNADDFDTRQRAYEALVQQGAPAVAPLRQALQDNPTLDFRARVEQVLRKLAIHEEGGAIVNGLKIRLAAERDTVKMDGKIKFTARLCNMTDEDMNVQVGYTTCGNYLECGAAYRLVDATGKLIQPNWRVGFCGTGAGPIVVTIPARTALDYPLDAILGFREGDKKQSFQLGVMNYCALPAEEDFCTFQVTLEAAAQAKSARDLGLRGVGVRPANENARYWVGKAQSNPVRIERLP